MPDHAFAFALCNVGSEPWLVREVARLVPGAAPSYRRKGLLTFKLPSRLPSAPEDALAGSVFARVHGRSLGLFPSPAELAPRLSAEPSLRLHVSARGAGPEGPDLVSVERALTVEAELRALLGARALEGVLASPGERVLDVVVAGGEPLLAGVRTQPAQGWRVPGGRPAIEVPPESPSCAFAKLEEALAWSGLALRPGERALELGSAPGGAAYALARRGVHVLGVDPAAMDPRVLDYVGPAGARVVHLPLEAGALRREHVPSDASLLVCDANLAPPVILRTVTSLARWMGPSLRAAVLTLKLNDERMLDAIPAMLERVAALGLEVRATQLPSNRREVCVVGVRTSRRG